MAKKSRIAKPSENAVYSVKYESFRGVDFSQDASMVDASHAPMAQNLISDTGGFPEKRVGWRSLKKFEGKINGLWRFEENEESGCFIVHAGRAIYRYSGGEDEPERLISDIADRKSFARYFKDRLIILTGEELLIYDGESVKRASESESTYAPTTTITRGVPQTWTQYESGNGLGADIGVTHEEVSLSSGRRRVTFSCAPASDKERLVFFLLDGKIAPNSRVVMTYLPTGKKLLDVTVGDDGQLAVPYFINKNPHGENGSEYPDIWDRENGVEDAIPRIYHTSDGANSAIRGILNTSLTEYYGDGEFVCVNGVDNIAVEYVCESEGLIDKCTFCEVYENRVFYSGNPDKPNVDWASGVNDASYVPDLNYTEIGADSTPIMGYLRTGQSLAILKAEGDDATVYMRNGSLQENGKMIFPVKQGHSGVGAVSRHAITSFLDDPIFLSKNGVYAIAQQDISAERALNLRSTRINKKLLAEANLKDAVVCKVGGYLILSVNGVCYVADAAQRSYTGNKTGTSEYEWYYWTNIPATCMCEHDGALYFGTEDGRICRDNSDLKNNRGELLPDAYLDDGEAIVAEWATNLSDDGDFMRLKTMVKKGSGVFLKAYNRSGVSVLIRTEADFGQKIAERSAGIFNFEDLNFDELTFNTAPYTVVPFNTKIKKYKAIQVICRNDKPGHAFGVFGIVRRYSFVKTYK